MPTEETYKQLGASSEKQEMSCTCYYDPKYPGMGGCGKKFTSKSGYCPSYCGPCRVRRWFTGLYPGRE